MSVSTPCLRSWAMSGTRITERMPTSRTMRRCSSSLALALSISSEISGYSSGFPSRSTLGTPVGASRSGGYRRLSSCAHRTFSGYGVRQRDLSDAVVRRDVDGAPVGKLRHDEVGELGERLLVVERAARERRSRARGTARFLGRFRSVMSRHCVASPPSGRGSSRATTTAAVRRPGLERDGNAVARRATHLRLRVAACQLRIDVPHDSSRSTRRDRGPTRQVSRPLWR